MATMQQQRQQTNTWSTIFPTEQVTQQQSALFVKKLLAVAISNITYLRTIFPEHAFGDRCLEDLSLKILRDDSACPGACQVIQWVKGCFDALDKQYLKTIVIGIYEDTNDQNTAVETYTFKFGYNREEGVTIFRNGCKLTGAYTESETRKATIKLLRTIVVLTQTLKPLPDDVMMTMKLNYYDEVTPGTYEPPGFQATTSEDFTFKQKPMNIRVGDVDTPFHSVKLRIKTDCQQFALCDDAEYSQKQVAEVEEREDGGKAETNGYSSVKDATQPPSSPAENTAAVGESRAKAVLPSTNSSATEPPTNDDSKMDTSSSRSVANGRGKGGNEGETRRESGEGVKVVSEGQKKKKGADSDENIVRCPCGCNEDDGLMVLCAVCDAWQHALCFALLSEGDVPETHVCVQCSHTQSGESKMRCTDPFLETLDPVTVQAACLWRRAVMACLEFNRVIPIQFARRLGVAVSVAQGLINRLEREGYIRIPMKNKRLGKIVNKDRIRMDGISKYFEKSRNESTVKLPKSHSENLELNGDRKMADITNGASSLSISQCRMVGGIVPSPQVAALQEEDAASGVRRSPRIVAKRVRSVADESLEFELSSSQDLEGSVADGCSRRKRRKASIASRSILV